MLYKFYKSIMFTVFLHYVLMFLIILEKLQYNILKFNNIK